MVLKPFAADTGNARRSALTRHLSHCRFFGRWLARGSPFVTQPAHGISATNGRMAGTTRSQASAAPVMPKLADGHTNFAFTTHIFFKNRGTNCRVQSMELISNSCCQIDRIGWDYSLANNCHSTERREASIKTNVTESRQPLTTQDID
ncbi:hypothetical protein [Hyphomicrobium sp.]|uniref:hypothetical protein n=1 Tax=Hyphomicrobium sp. TaxID=82 RepID=UPI001E066F3B|nr:hypothetical protein [Hyphomicrobium sp.]MBY0558305.1 hypothetical protein [Hyphomicrobium sp.]